MDAPLSPTFSHVPTQQSVEREQLYLLKKSLQRFGVILAIVSVFRMFMVSV
jgi:hypothetical protein